MILLILFVMKNGVPLGKVGGVLPTLPTNKTRVESLIVVYSFIGSISAPTYNISPFEAMPGDRKPLEFDGWNLMISGGLCLSF